MSSNTYLITGANRGIGKGLTAALLQRPNTTVIAGVRDTTASAPILSSLPTAAGSKVIIVKIDSQSETDAKEAVSRLNSEHGITSFDVVIANAGVAHSGTSIAQTTTKSLRDHFDTNAIGPLLLFQAVKPLLQASQSGKPVFLAMSTVVGSIGGQEAFAGLPPVLSPYGASKAALNWIVRRLHYEETWLTAYVTHPGLVLTDMGSGMFGTPEQSVAMGAITVDISVAGILKTLDSASRGIGGSFQNYDGTTLPW
ncbi:aflatoxin biosynthesis ketoreductase nor-1 [Didymella exigua CBS 183.55]|uniref:Aflatoxin biosynthesis ketoreductase nor-1 n=1 Tax=Didymella exigua CBS 183.55 TaxID=1150837 RepID=A0A6A5RRN6_9PLEO|nr:aflatoxin biosynthesis ketoreductase nor-1 [Didymella exigua CBS 183.55]KAF1931101.1 aflatoxin biosynthesis ketoreductase nor-1 [Didymella exigua CBS 183.55]